MRKLFIIGGIFLLVSQDLFSQARRSVFLEIGANGVGFSLNYDARFKKKENGFGFRVGMGYFPPSGSPEDIFWTSSFFSIPIGINHLAGKGPHYFESGLGATYISAKGGSWWEEEEAKGVAFVPSIGYRYAKIGKGFQFRAVISPMIGSGGAAMWGGISFGYKF